MKKLLCLCLLAFIVSSCKKNYCGGDSEPTGKIAVYKLKDTSYLHNILVQCDEKTHALKQYSVFYNSGEVIRIFNHYKILSDLYILSYGNPFYSNGNACTDITYSEAETFWEDSLLRGNLRDTLQKRIVDFDPIQELYLINEDDSIFCEVFNNQEVGHDVIISRMIESGDFFTYKGVTKKQ